MDIYIETLTGAAFELRVSPFETVMSVKAKIQRQEGIPISQQHLIWQSIELDDDYCLHDYNIQDGAALKMVLAMRGGPINTRRVPLEDPALREMADYMDANREDILEKVPGNRQVTLLVYREGDQLNFFRVVDRGDGTLTPLSDSISGTSMYNLNEDGDEEKINLAKMKAQENDQTKEKMKELRTKMEHMNLSKKRCCKRRHVARQTNNAMLPKPPSNAAPVPTMNKYRNLATPLQNEAPGIHMSLHNTLPPVGKTVQSILSTSPQLVEAGGPSAVGIGDHKGIFSRKMDHITSAKLQRLPSLSENHVTTPSPNSLHSSPLELGLSDSDSVDPIGRRSQLQSSGRRRDRLSPEVLAALTERSNTHISRASSTVIKGTLEQNTCSEVAEESSNINRNISRTKDYGTHSNSLNVKHHAIDKVDTQQQTLKQNSYMTPAATGFTNTRASERKQGFMLESLSHSEARGLLRQTSLERLGSSKINNLVPSSSRGKSQLGLSHGNKDNHHHLIQHIGRMRTPEGRLLSSRIQKLSTGGRDSRSLITSPRLPPVKQKKKSKRCWVCGKKTGLATSYSCRCGNNYCATHRYAEAHSCTFDYKSEGRKLLEQSNPVVTAPKLPKI